MKQRGFAPLFLIIIFAIIGVIGIYLLGKGGGKNNPVASPQIEVKESPLPSATNIVPSSTPQEVYFISPNNGQEVTEGKSYWVELYFPNPSNVSQVEIGMGKADNPSNLTTLTQPPFKYLQKIPDPSSIAPYLGGQNSAYLVALITYKSGAKETKSVKLTVLPPQVSVWFVQPERGKIFHPDDKIQVQAGFNTPEEKIVKVEFFYTSQLIKSFTSEPYSFELKLVDYCKGMAKQTVPLSVTATLSSGQTISDATDVNCQI